MRGALGAIDDGVLSPLGSSAGPKSVSSENWLLASTNTIFGRAFHGVKRASVDERGNSTTTGRTDDGSSRKAATTPSFAGDVVDARKNVECEVSNPNKSAKIVARTANISLPLMTPVDES